MNASNQEPTSISVVRAVATEVGCRPDELDERLSTAVDPDALDRLFGRSGDDSPRVRFTFCGYDVTVSDESTVTVVPNDGPSP